MYFISVHVLAGKISEIAQWEKGIMQFLDRGSKSIGLQAHSLPMSHKTYRGGRECAFSPIDFEPLSKNYIMLFSHYQAWVVRAGQFFPNVGLGRSQKNNGRSA